MSKIILIITCALITFSIGSNDTSNALSICIGSQVIKFKKAVLLFGCFVLMGVTFQGQRVMQTVGKDLLRVNITILNIALFISALLILFSNWRKLPLSTHQVIIGGLTGAGMVFKVEIDFSSLVKIVFSWIISPLGAFFFSLILYRVMEKTLSKLPLFQIERILRILLLVSGFLIAYNTGANELATVLGGIVHVDLMSHLQASLVGSFFVFLGAILLSHRVIETVGKEMVALDPYSGFAAQFGAGTCILLFTSLGMPVSTTYCIIGGLSGVGVPKGIETIKINLIKKIVLSWVLAPCLAFLICFTLAKILR